MAQVPTRALLWFVLFCLFCLFFFGVGGGLEPAVSNDSERFWSPFLGQLVFFFFYRVFVIGRAATCATASHGLAPVGRKPDRRNVPFVGR